MAMSSSIDTSSASIAALASFSSSSICRFAASENPKIA